MPTCVTSRSGVRLAHQTCINYLVGAIPDDNPFIDLLDANPVIYSIGNLKLYEE